MTDENSESDEGHRQSNCMRAVVGLGIALFIAGFILTVTSLPEAEPVAAHGGSVSYSGDSYASIHLALAIGLMMSLVGVVMATAAPAAQFIKSQRPHA